MRGVAKFLLGGALGALLGILISRKQSQKTQKSERAAWHPSSLGGTPVSEAPAPQGPVVSPPVGAREPVVTWPAEELGVAEFPAAAEAPVAAATVVAPPEAPVAEVAVEAEPAPVAEVAVEPEEPSVVEVPIEPEEPPVAEVAIEPGMPLMPEVAVAPEAGLIVEGPEVEAVMAEVPAESEVVVTPELLEEPLPGAGWEPSPALAGEEAFEEILPFVPEDVIPSAGPGVTVGEAVAVEEAGLEERTLGEVGPGEVARQAPEAIEFEAVPGEVRVEPSPIEAAPVEYTPEAYMFPAPALEVAPAPAPVFAPTPPSTPAATHVASEDLKARIEETRRRIRKELEEPFLVPGPVESREEIASPPTPEPVIGEALVAEPAAQTPGEEETPSPGGDVTAVVGEELLPAGLTQPTEGEPAPASETGVDYEAMRRRIEITRNRLKAKAFDAMMTGESSLLRRDSGEGAVDLPAPAAVSNDIAQTIETTLREEET